MDHDEIERAPVGRAGTLKLFLPSLFVALLAACGTGDDTAATAKPEKVLHVYNWADYVAESTLPTRRRRFTGD